MRPGHLDRAAPDRHHVDLDQVVDGQPVPPGEQPVPAAADVAARADRIAGPGRNGHPVLAEERGVHVPVGGAALDGVGGATVLVGSRPDPAQCAEVENDALVVVDESLVAVAAAAHGRPQSSVERRAQLRHRVGLVADQPDVRRAAAPALVEALAERLVAGVRGEDRPALGLFDGPGRGRAGGADCQAERGGGGSGGDHSGAAEEAAAGELVAHSWDRLSRLRHMGGRRLAKEGQVNPSSTN
ncbi:hypothetical protein KPATCC21470_1188 [Kitasatospora purpeofusca]